MPTKRAVIRILVMLCCVLGMTYGAMQIPRLPAGPRRILARFGCWLQKQAEPKVVAARVDRTLADLPRKAQIQAPQSEIPHSETMDYPNGDSMRVPTALGDTRTPVEESVSSRETTDPFLAPMIPPKPIQSAPSVPGLSPSGGAQSIIGPLDRPTGERPLTETASSLAELASQLQKLGATNYLLEKWGDDGQLYRFQCEVAIGGQPGLHRHFEAVAPTGEEAIRRVLAGVTSNQ
ncbi:MAG: hypothetical protein JW829_06250 [Pirellulales bacterium]|nr:hypothetical protein [Pirellulales bacterium]